MFEKIAILTDSACDLPREIIQKYGIKVLPLKVIYGNQAYSDREDIQPEEVYSRMPEEIPTTSMPAPEEIKTTLEKIREEGFSHVLALHLSSKLSGTYNTVKMIAREINDLKIKVLDTKTLSIGSGFIVMEAAKSIASGMSWDKVVEHVQKIQSQVKVFYVIETLEYLRRGGRIGKVASMLGQFLHIKPIISVDEEGQYFVYAKAKGRKKSIEKLAEIVEETVQNKKINLAVMHGGAKEEFEKLVERLKKLPNIQEFICSDISPTLGVHTGPGLLGVSFYEV